MRNELVANGKVYQRTPFKKMYLPAAAGDARGAIGAAFSVWHQLQPQSARFHMNDAGFGPHFDNKELRQLLNTKAGDFDSQISAVESLSDAELCKKTAAAINDGKVVGWFQGRMVFQVRNEKRLLIPAVTHVDGSGRLQTVHKETNSLYHQLITNFYELTGVPMVLNTSFNENEPVVCRPEEALDCFLRTKMDMLVLGNFFVERKSQKIGDGRAKCKVNKPQKTMTFEDLESWQQARQLTREIYVLIRTDTIAKDFGLCGQIQRAGVSIMSNIAEGFERQHIQEKLQFYNVAHGSNAG